MPPSNTTVPAFLQQAKDTPRPDFRAEVAALPGAKPTNPKDSVGSGKLPLELVPDVLVAEAAFAFLEGALKYGRYNWRVAGVRASIYRAALHRHLMCWWNGEDVEPLTGVRHLASIAACVGILLDAELCGMLTDDRPPRAPIGARVRDAEAHVAALKELFADRVPHQYTIDDSSIDLV